MELTHRKTLGLFAIGKPQSILGKPEEHGDEVKRLTKNLHGDAACHAPAMKANP
jgi:hypothetical protein